MSVLVSKPKLLAQSDAEERLRWESDVHDALGRFRVGTVELSPGAVGAGADVIVLAPAPGVAAGMALALTAPAGFPAGLRLTQERPHGRTWE